ncbi:DUF2254 domain-containing protein [uncultured Nonlabens sp.]|uniref:DUF2254 domain-containing protein n=1 Tax=uncultured Nonlabens sp. TaxID=859306 RepID=UPI00262E3126|nr:DUF2254 domain-containing protein [uncultured Nonlabens sp.]
MQSLIIRLRSFFNTITGSIAFYPTFYAIIAILFAIIMKVAEGYGISKSLQESLPIIVINDIDTARNILTTLIAGGISMLVFSFSMVMLLLSQAAANYSPRVLPNLISNKRHQYILGSFLATILYNIITIIGIEPTGDNYQLPGFSVLLGIFSTIVALAAFVYFIHSISTSIQINTILENIYNKSSKRLQVLIKQQTIQDQFPETNQWYTYFTNRSGTIQNISVEGLKKSCETCKTRFEMLITKGKYILEGEALFKSEVELNNRQQTEVYKNFNYSESELVSDNYTLGFKQITEIGIKAMSPGINDPGTAIDTIDYLTDLVRLRMLKKDHNIVLNEDKEVLIKLNTTKFEDLIYDIFASYRKYCKEDLSVMSKLLQLFSLCMGREACQQSYYTALYLQAKLLVHDAQESISNSHDIDRLKAQFESIETQYHQLSSN